VSAQGLTYPQNRVRSVALGCPVAGLPKIAGNGGKLLIDIVFLTCLVDEQSTLKAGKSSTWSDLAQLSHKVIHRIRG
jgi:hypothetical protein